MNTLERINSVLESLAAIDNRGSYYNPRRLEIDWTRREGCSYRLVSPIKTNKGVALSAYVKDTDDSERIREIACGLIARAIDQFEADQLADERKAAQERAERERKAAQQQVWIDTVRVAFGGVAGEKLPEDLKPRVLSDSQLVDAGKPGWSGGYSVQVPLPLDLTKRAQFLAELDAFLATRL